MDDFINLTPKQAHAVAEIISSAPPRKGFALEQVRRGYRRYLWVYVGNTCYQINKAGGYRQVKSL